ncbi:MAG: outer membrane protein assembly factor BamE [Planctomycetota bacterium]
MKRFAPAVLLLALGSCFMSRSSTNEPLDPRLLSTLEPGMPAHEVVALLGAPDFVVRLHDKGSAYLYEHTAGKSAGLFLLLLLLANEDIRSDRVWVFLDAGNRTTHVARTLAAERVEYALPWEDLHDELPERTGR